MEELINKNAIIFNGKYGLSPLIQFTLWNLIVCSFGALLTLLVLALKGVI